MTFPSQSGAGNAHLASWLDVARCPGCHGDLAVGGGADADTVTCSSCGQAYPSDPAVGLVNFLATTGVSENKENIQHWWGDLYNQLYRPTDDVLTKELLADLVDSFEDLMVRREHLAAVEMPLKDLAGKRVLEIGPGGGGHSCLFKRHGARTAAVDITPERALSTARKLELMDGPPSVVFQADAERLPFSDDSFDIVYSNGVLHHAEHTTPCVAEVLRVLRPGGKAVIMLYSRHSSAFWMNILPRGVLSGEVFSLPEAEWVGRVTEGKPKFGQTRNPYTRVYSKRQIQSLFHDFNIVSLRKSSFRFDDFAIPRLSQLRNWLLTKTGLSKPHDGGILVYGQPFVPETGVELLLGNLVGFSWNIVAEKPVR